jgi:CHAD domain
MGDVLKAPRDPWPRRCRRDLVGAVLEAADLFPHSGQDNAAQIHAARKALKHARALIRLFIPSAELAAYAAIDALDKARRRIGLARDLDVMRDVAASLGDDLDAGAARQLADAIALEREVARVAHGDIDVLSQTSELRALARSIESWDVAETSSASLLTSVRATYRGARRLGGAAFESGAPGELHEVRAFVVDLGHQLAALLPAWPALFLAMDVELNKLRQGLGAYNDLAILGEFANGRRELSLERLSDLRRQIERRQRRLARRAKGPFMRLFNERPRVFEKRLAAYLANPKPQARTHQG